MREILFHASFLSGWVLGFLPPTLSQASAEAKQSFAGSSFAYFSFKKSRSFLTRKL
jgi:hypothetical protein